MSIGILRLHMMIVTATIKLFVYQFKCSGEAGGRRAKVDIHVVAEFVMVLLRAKLTNTLCT